MSEIIDIVNDYDCVIWSCNKYEIYKLKCIHRVIHIILFNSEKKISLQLRSKEENFLPWYWFSSVWWHVQAWENYEQAAYRELKEELWIHIPLKFLWKQLYCDQYDKNFFKFQTVFEAKYDWDVCINNIEFDDIVFFSLQEVKQMIVEWKKIHLELLDILYKYYNL